MTHIVTIASEKGGVGKTTIAVNLAARAHQRGLKTLLVDLDQQCSASFASIGNVDSIRDASKSVIELWDEDVEPTFIDSEFGFSLLKSCSQMDSVDDDLPAAKVALSRLKNYGFDCIIIDSPPAAGVRQFAAIQMSDVYLIPTTLDRISLFSFADTVSHFYDMHRPTKADISLYAVFNMHLATSASQKKVISTLREQLSIVMDEVLTTREIVRYALAEYLPIWDYAPKDKIAPVWMAMCDKLLEQAPALATPNAEYPDNNSEYSEHEDSL